jgi:glutathione S-transferase
MITLYHCMSARSFRTLWTLEELGLPYTLKVMPFPPRFLERSFLDINPLGTVPFMVDGDAHMTESAATCHYLACRYGDGALSVPVHDPRYGAWLNWLHMGEATLTFPQTLVLRYSRFEPPERRLPSVAHDYARWFLARLKAVDLALADGRPWLLGDNFTAADISVGYAVMLSRLLGLDAQWPPHIAPWWERLSARPGYQRALAAQDAAALACGVATSPATQVSK